MAPDSMQIRLDALRPALASAMAWVAGAGPVTAETRPVRSLSSCPTFPTHAPRIEGAGAEKWGVASDAILRAPDFGAVVFVVGEADERTIFDG